MIGGQGWAGDGWEFSHLDELCSVPAHVPVLVGFRHVLQVTYHQFCASPNWAMQGCSVCAATASTSTTMDPPP